LQLLTPNKQLIYSESENLLQVANKAVEYYQRAGNGLCSLRAGNMAAENILTTIESLKGQVSQKYKAEIKGIFGSFARGNQTNRSDIDVLVEFHRGADLFDFVGLSQFLEQRLNCKIDVVPLSSLREEIKDYVLKEVVYL